MPSIDPFIEQTNASYLSQRRLLADSLSLTASTSASLTRLTDQWLTTLWSHASHALPFPSILIAVGGYGAQRLSFGSDIDVVIHTDPSSDQIQPLHNAVHLWMDWCRATRVKVKHAVRPTANLETAFQEDLRTAISYLDARLIVVSNPSHLPPWNDPLSWITSLRNATTAWLRGNDQGQSFVAQLWTLSQHRREQVGQTVYLLEPDVKQGKGGQRDLQSLIWAARVRFLFDPLQQLSNEAKWGLDEQHTLQQSDLWIQLLRLHLHLTGKRPTDRLRFPAQRIIAPLWLKHMEREVPLESRDQVETFLRLHFEQTRAGARLVERFLRLWSIGGEPLPEAPNRANLLPQSHLWSPAEVGQILLRTDLQRDLLHPADEHTMEESIASWQGEDLQVATTTFRSLITDIRLSPKTPLRLLELGWLTRVIPEFSQVVCHVQHDLYHVYTTDVHLLKCHETALDLMQHRALHLGIVTTDDLHHPLSPLCHDDAWKEVLDVACQIQNPDLFSVAVLFHDIGKNRGGGHSRIGANLMHTIGARLGFSNEETETLSFLVREHLTLSDTARRRDISDRRILRDLVHRIRTTDTLNMLLCLTFCDMANVGQGVLTDWNRSLILLLYQRLLAGITGHDSDLWAPQSQAFRNKRALLAQRFIDLRGDTLENAFSSLDEFLRDAPINYVLTLSTDALLRIYDVFHEANHDHDRSVVVRLTPIPETETTELIVWTQDRPGALAKITGCISSLGLNILSAQIATTNRNFALDVFQVAQSGGASYAMSRATQRALTDQFRIDQLTNRLHQVLSGQVAVESLLAKRLQETRLAQREIPEVDVSVRLIPDASDDFSVFEVRAPDRIGLLYQLAACLEGFTVNIHRTIIDCLGTQVIDTFFIESNSHQPLDAPSAERIRQSLHEVASATSSLDLQPP